MPAIRPDHLPDFDSPPINEVVLGVQFSPPKGYQQIRAGEVWRLFKPEYPLVQETQALDPQFETFGPELRAAPAGRVSFVTGALHDRFWFLREDKSELIQFQQDRLLHNWRRLESNVYPRFEKMIESFQSELEALQKYFLESFGTEALAINQCEISYINHIRAEAVSQMLPRDWLAGFDYVPTGVEDFAATYRETILDSEGKPLGRFFYEANSGISGSGNRIIILTLTVRGPPVGTTIDAAKQFLTIGREIIVSRFAELTTASAHKAWKRVK